MKIQREISLLTRSRRVCRIVTSSLFVVSTAFSFLGCGDESGPAPRGVDYGQGGAGGTGGQGSSGTAGDGGAGGNGGSSSVVCVDGSQKKCHVDLGVNNGVKSCFDGVQVCSNGVWGLCGNPP